jgi:hypothetical protein
MQSLSEEASMPNIKLLATALALSVATVTLGGPAVAAKQKQAKTPSYQEAWAICKKFTDENIWSWDQHGQRLQRGGSCMLRYGYRFGDYPD